MFYEGYNTYYTYILTNRNKTVLYVGVTNSLIRRLPEHKKHPGQKNKSFTAKYQCVFLIYYEKHSWIQEAIAREKEMKGWNRKKKEALINEHNPAWEFLNQKFITEIF